MENKPIQSQEEADKAFNYLVKTLMGGMNISEEQATKRVKALFESGILEGGSPTSILTQMKISKFLSKPID